MSLEKLVEALEKAAERAQNEKLVLALERAAERQRDVPFERGGERTKGLFGSGFEDEAPTEPVTMPPEPASAPPPSLPIAPMAEGPAPDLPMEVQDKVSYVGGPTEYPDRPQGLPPAMEAIQKHLVNPFKASLFGGKVGEFEGPGSIGMLLEFLEGGRRGVEETGVPEALWKAGIPIGKEGSLQRTILTSPELAIPGVGPAVRGAKALVRGTGLVAKEATKAGLKAGVAAYRAGPAAGEAGAMLSPGKLAVEGIKFSGRTTAAVVRGAQQFGEVAWTKGLFGAIEKAAMKIDRKAFGGALKASFGTTPARMGEEFAMGLRDIVSGRIISAAQVRKHGKELIGLTSEQQLEASRYIMPRVAGTAPVKPSLLSEKQIAVLDDFRGSLQEGIKEAVELGRISPQTGELYMNGWFPRLLRDKSFLKAEIGGLSTPIRMKGIHYRKDAYGVVTKGLSKAEAETILKDAGMNIQLPEKPLEQMVRERWTALTKGERKTIGGTQKPWEKLTAKQKETATADFEWLNRAEGLPVEGRVTLSELTTTTKGDKTLVKFSSPEQQEEFIRRYRQAHGKKANVVDRFDPMTEEELAALDELIDPRVNIYNGLANMRTENAKYRFFERISKNDEMALPMSSELEAKGWIQLPDRANLGPLRGMAVPKPVYRELQGVDAMLGRKSGMQRAWGAFLTEWKAGKTIMSMRTHARNFLGNYMFSALSDTLAPWFGGIHNTPHYLKAVKSLIKKDELWEEMLKNGIIGTQYADAELGLLQKAITASTTPEKAGSALGKYLKEWARHPISGGPLGKPAAIAYNLEDGIYRAAAFVKARSKGLNALDATAHVNRWYPNYAEVGPKIKDLSQSVIGGPFSRFAAEATRILYNGVKHKPIKTSLVVAGVPYGWSQLAKATTGMSDIEYDAVKERGSYALPWMWRDNEGNVDTIAFDYIIPIGNQVNFLFGNKYNRDEGIRRWMDMTGPFVFGNPVFTVPMGLISRTDPYSGYDIQRPGERESTANRRFVGEQLAPGTLHPLHLIPSPGKERYTPIGREGRKLTDTLRGRPHRSGQKRTLDRTLIDIVGGLNPIPYDPQTEQDRAERQKNWIDMEETSRKAAFGKKRGRKKRKDIFPEEREAGIKTEERIQGEKRLPVLIDGLRAEIVKLERKIKAGKTVHRKRVARLRRNLRTLLEIKAKDGAVDSRGKEIK